MVLGAVSRLWSMSLQAGILILVVLAIRFLLKKYPKIYVYFMWMLVGVRLLCPVFVETSFSLQPENIRPDGIAWNRGLSSERGSYSDGQPVENKENDTDLSGKENVPFGGSGTMDAGVSLLPSEIDIDMNHLENPDLSGNSESNDKGIIHTFFGKIFGSEELSTKGFHGGTFDLAGASSLLVIIYLAGVGAFALIYLAQYVLMRYRISTAVRGRENVWFCEKIDSPFVLGIIRPKIIMPYGLKKQEGYHILKHEQTHIKHHDPFIRMVGTICICLHWWNPLVWLAVSKMNQDMEMFCDEAVLRDASSEEKKSYAKTLLSFAVRRSGLSVGLAFGESHTERRVRNLMRKRKGGILVTGLVAVMAVFCVAAFMTIPGIEAEGADIGITNSGVNNIGDSGIQTGVGSSNANNGGMGSNAQMISGAANGDFLLTEEEVEYLTELCPRIPDFASEQEMNEDFWKEFLFNYYTSDFDRETADRYVGQLGFEVPYAKVSYDEVQHTVEQIFGNPLSAYVEDPRILVQDYSILYEEDSFYISLSDSPDYKCEYVSDTNADILKQVELLEGLYDEEDYRNRIYLFLLPADNERGFIISGKDRLPVLQDISGGMIKEQSFDVEINPYGQVTFATYAPNTELNPGDDVAFKLIQDGQVLYIFGGYDIRQDKTIWKFQNVAAVSFPDINGDGYTDVITIVNYKFGDSTFSEARIYTGRENRYFLEEEYLEEMYNNSYDNKTVSEIIRFVALPENQDFYVRKSIYGRWRVTEHIPPAGIYALSEEEIESFENTQLQYGRYWYQQGSNDPYILDNYKKESVTVSEFEEGFRTNIQAMGLSVTEFDYFELEGVQNSASLFGQYFYQIDTDNALIYYEGVFFRAVRE